MIERSLWQLLREYDIDLVTAQHICNDAMINGVTVSGTAARIEALEAALINTAAHLAASISLLERTPKANKAAPSDTMFNMMLADYKKSLAEARAALDKDVENE